jgi:hypothetical protein
MPEFNLKVKMTNAAFEDYPATELAKILRDAADDIEYRGGVVRGDLGFLTDTNGNMVGFWKVT